MRRGGKYDQLQKTNFYDDKGEDAAAAHIMGSAERANKKKKKKKTLIRPPRPEDAFGGGRGFDEEAEANLSDHDENRRMFE